MTTSVRLYKTTGEDADLKVHTVWTGTQRDARAARKAMKSDGYYVIETEEVDFPITKSGLIPWLNENDVGETSPWKDARTYLTELYLDWLNNYLSVAKFAEHNGITEAQAMSLLDVARSVFNTKHPDA